MGLFDQVKNRLATNFKFTQLTFMAQPAQIIAFCQKLTPEERAGVLKGIESAFRWQPVAQIAQAMYPMFAAPHHGVSDDAMDLIHGGFVSGGVELMAIQNQVPPTPQLGLTAQQQSALAFAWLVLRRLEGGGMPVAGPATESSTPSSPAPSEVRFCSGCGTRTQVGAAFCSSCGRRL